ncbi:MAG: T9SS type A sorting domain-containing protein [Bacteroidales bacterium]|nr:T9SS type A sorting domain-containing protein [Bacteroidales bacterium]
MLISINDTYISLTDSTEFLGNIEPGGIIDYNDAFIFSVSNFIPNEHSLDINTLITALSDVWESHIYLTAYAPAISVGSVTISDGGNGALDPGETVDLILNLENNGGATANNIVSVLSSSDQYITINDSICNIVSLEAYSNDDVTYNITASDEIPIGYIIDFDINIAADNEYTSSDQIYLIVGFEGEDFETGDFSSYPWVFGGNADWVIDDNTPYEGIYCARSGAIGDNEKSSLSLELCVLTNGNISFYKKVSSETSYDFLSFYIDGSLKGQWGGEIDWSIEIVPVTQGLHTFKWIYEKDYSVSNGQDCGWVDYIIFPPMGDANPQLSVNPEFYDLALDSGYIETDLLILTNTGEGPLVYSIEVSDTASKNIIKGGKDITWLSINSYSGGLNTEETDELVVTFNATNLEEGDYFCNIIVKDHMDNETIVPVSLHVTSSTGTGNENNIDITKLYNNFPNPFNKETIIRFSLTDPVSVNLDIYDINGKKIRTLISENEMTKGKYSIIWNGKDAENNFCSPGIYLYKFSAGKRVFIKKMILMR